jgi:Family of unknown function (DUF6325)
VAPERVNVARNPRRWTVPFDHAAIGPVELLVVAFPGSQFRGEIVPALKELVDNGTIRILDLVFIAKERDGTVVKLELSEAGDVVALEYQELAASDDLEAFISDDDLESAAEALDPGDSAAILVWEDLWAIRFRDAVRNANGEILALERVPPEALEMVLDVIDAG